MPVFCPSASLLSSCILAYRTKEKKDYFYGVLESLIRLSGGCIPRYLLEQEKMEDLLNVIFINGVTLIPKIEYDKIKGHILVGGD